MRIQIFDFFLRGDLGQLRRPDLGFLDQVLGRLFCDVGQRFPVLVGTIIIPGIGCGLGLVIGNLAFDHGQFFFVLADDRIDVVDVFLQLSFQGIDPGFFIGEPDLVQTFFAAACDLALAHGYFSVTSIVFCPTLKAMVISSAVNVSSSTVTVSPGLRYRFDRQR